MIIVDLSQVILANLFQNLGNHATGTIDTGLLRHMILNSIKSYKKKFGDEYGELVIACDGMNYWRKDEFPYYKANRKKHRDSSDLDWKSLFESINMIRDEIKEVFPYRVIHHDKIEADDVISVLCHRFGTPLGDTPKMLILSSDKDFPQLQKFSNVSQYSPSTKKWISTNDPHSFLVEHIIRGDEGDGVPNMFMSDASLVEGEKKKRLYQKKIDSWVASIGENIDDPSSTFINTVEIRNYYRNKKMVDLDVKNLPEYVVDEINRQFDDQAEKVGDRSRLFNYFFKHKLKQHMEALSEF